MPTRGRAEIHETAEQRCDAPLPFARGQNEQKASVARMSAAKRKDVRGAPRTGARDEEYC